MFGRLGHFMYRRRWYVVGTWIVVLIVAGAFASQVGSVLGPGNFVLKGSDSAKAAGVLDQKFHQNDQKTLLIVMHNPTEKIGSPSFDNAVAAVTRRIRADKKLQVQFLDNPVLSHNPQLISKDKHSATLLVSSRLKENDLEAQVDPLRKIVTAPGFTTYVTGTAALNRDYAKTSSTDLQKGESITSAIVLVILLLVFGTLIAASIPLLLAILGIAVSLAFVFVFGHFLDTSIYVTNVVTFLGLGISIDYSLFIVYRFREELKRSNGDAEMAIVHTMQTTGRAVFFSGLTVAIGLSSLILTNVSFMVSMGLGGMLVPFSALLVAMSLLPAVLGLLGERINKPYVINWLSRLAGGGFRNFVQERRMRRASHDRHIWRNIAHAVMARPLISGGAALLIMLGLTFPLTQLNLQFGGLKNSPNVESVAGYNFMRNNFTSNPDPAQIVIQHNGPGNLLEPNEVAAIRSLETTLRRDPQSIGVVGPADFVSRSGAVSPAQLKLMTGRYLTPDHRVALIIDIPKHEVGTKPNTDMLERIRTESKAAGSGSLRGNAVVVGGAAADYLDFNAALYDKFPIILALVLALTAGFLFFAFRTIFLPLKAVLLNLLSVGAAFGVLQLVFQRGIGHTLLGFSPEDGVAPWVPIMLFAFLFGLSMDYEVILISRMRERWLSTGYNRDSVAYGLEKTGRLITSAALIMCVAFSGLLIGHEVQLKEFGFGLFASIALDATIIRIILVPAIMEIMGRWNWWVPARLSEFAKGGSAFEEGPEESVSPEVEAATVI